MLKRAPFDEVPRVAAAHRAAQRPRRNCAVTALDATNLAPSRMVGSHVRLKLLLERQQRIARGFIDCQSPPCRRVETGSYPKSDQAGRACSRPTP
jgi:hypothetical protein